MEVQEAIHCTCSISFTSPCHASAYLEGLYFPALSQRTGRNYPPAASHLQARMPEVQEDIRCTFPMTPQQHLAS